MLLELPIFWIIALNVGGWLGIQMGLAWLFTRLPSSWFANVPTGATWEVRNRGHAYERLFFVREWKHLLPDGAAWFTGGFQKARLLKRDRRFLDQYLAETWKGELCHWAALTFTPLFFLWNPLWADFVILMYAITANVPCIVAQRYNRVRMQHALKRRLRSKR